MNDRDNKKPWLTRGLINACRKKQQLYWQNIRKRTETSEIKYKCYRNKLTNILRSAEKRYYSELLNQHKKNIKESWKILNKCINKGRIAPIYPDTFKINGKNTTNTKEIANGFNSFFSNVGPSLASKLQHS